MAKLSQAKASFSAKAEVTAKSERDIQNKIDRSDEKAKVEKNAGAGAMQAGARLYPVPPLPKQHLKKPGLEADLDLQPMYDAPHYKGSEKLLDKVALITGADFRHRPRRGRPLRPRGRRCRNCLSRRA